ncbi:MAG TPA: ABC transporter permease [Actinomycetota bacterium]|nr:ABC transporter permease [Actinomycetota bacterium]
MSITEAEAAQLSFERPSGLWADAWDRFKRNPAALVGIVLIVVFILAAIFAAQIAPFEPNEQAGPLATNPAGPGGEHLLGLDMQGRDVFTRILFGARLSLLVGLVSVSVGLALGLVLGSLAGYLGGRVDFAIMRVMDLMLSVPGLLLAIALVTVMGRGLISIMLAVGIVQVPTFARLLRGSILGQREADYVLAARSVGVPGRRVLLGHILPNSIAPVIVQATLAMATAIIEVAALSFVGLGPNDPRLPEWGKMLAENANRLQQSVHLVLFPGLAIVFSTLGINLIGDGLREAIDPKLKT